MTNSINTSQQGGHLSIVIPYRDRLEHLRRFVLHMNDFMQNIDYQLVVVEQADDRLFNRGKLKNIGFSLSSPKSDFICFHDVDMLPVDNTAEYVGVTTTTHLAGRIEQFGFTLPYPEYVGGVLLVTKDQFVQVNGYSNEYWGWGEEDDDLFLRYHMVGLKIDRKDGRYVSLPHAKSEHPRENIERISKTLVEASKRCCDPALLRRIEQEIRKLRLQTDSPESDSMRDGLSNLSYSLVQTHPLSRLVPGIEDGEVNHRVISVLL